MKKVLLFLFFPFLIQAQTDTEVEEVAWLTDYADATEKARDEKQNLLVYFTGSDWCQPCKLLKRDFFDTEAFKNISSNYILVYVDMPRNKLLLSRDQLRQNRELLGKFNKKGVFPLIAILNSKEKVLDELSGYNMDGNIKKHLNLVEKHKD